MQKVTIVGKGFCTSGIFISGLDVELVVDVVEADMTSVIIDKLIIWDPLRFILSGNSNFFSSSIFMRLKDFVSKIETWNWVFANLKNEICLFDCLVVHLK